MGFFSRKKKQQEANELHIELPELKHEHVWKDMPWYMETVYSGTAQTASYEIIEPYICITCGERKNTVLEKCSWEHINSAQREEEFTAIRKRYRKYLKPRAVVEDMINNILLVKDPEYLDMVESMRGTPHRRCGTSANMKHGDDKQPKIELEE